MEDNIIECVNVSKSYNGIKALDGVTLTIKTGEIFVLAGPNGAGKTTLLESIEGLRKPDNGTIKIFGKGVESFGKQLYYRLGVELQENSLPKKITVYEIVKLYSYLLNVILNPDELIRTFGLDEYAKKYCTDLSGGTKRKLLLLLSLIGNRELIILDEPTSGIDPQSRRFIWEYLRKLRGEGKTIVVTTHSLNEAFDNCDRFALMNKGKIIFQSSRQNFFSETPVKYVGIVNNFHKDSSNLEYEIPLQKGYGTLYCYGKNEEEIKNFFIYLQKEFKVGNEDMVIRKISFEDLFLYYTGIEFKEDGKDEN
ncbi:ABC transporter ATP-binding protein [Caldisericum exile]|uniref:ABC transporter ATP-binding protein n=1 Tax=Caldisericum exile (strain DSM 21853 / NBRC 104410 / AZM16c01) TaxID=511051 RepID=A0A7U6JFK1_CALEA|nr:ABC transporter ATP-binding protein [Caldisericum exile]BAL80240.1 putative ABC transporter ATP-binding protein [Caldisericum exile AZM16c01]